MTVKALVEQAKKLSSSEQAELLDELLLLVETHPDRLALTPAQAEDLDRRLEEMRSGKEKLIPGDEAVELIRRRRQI